MTDDSDGRAACRAAKLAACLALALVAACARHRTDDADARKEERQRPVKG